MAGRFLFGGLKRNWVIIKMLKIKVSIIVAVYNKEYYVLETLRSLSGQSYEHIEIIIINDGSSDGCPEICENFSKVDGRVIYVSKENSGVIDARNLGFSMATGDIIISFDADDIMPDDFVAKIVDCSLAHPEADVFAPGIEAIGERSGPVVLPSIELPAFLTRNAIPNSSAFRSRALSKVPGYNPSMRDGLEDWDFWLYFVENGMRIVRVPGAFYYYRVTTGSRNNMTPMKRLRLEKKIYENHVALYERWMPSQAVINSYPLSKLLRLVGLSKDSLRLAKMLREIGRLS